MICTIRGITMLVKPIDNWNIYIKQWLWSWLLRYGIIIDKF